MGNDLKCHIGESEEEVVEKICSSIPFSEISVKESYEEFKKCISANDIGLTSSTGSINKNTLNYFSYSTFINSVVSSQSNKCKIIHSDYFDNLRRMDDCIPTIGTIIIMLSNGCKEEKIDYLNENYSNYYGTISSDVMNKYIKNVITANTNVCIYSFNSTFGFESTKKLNEICSEARKKKLEENIMVNYKSVFDKYYKNETPSPETMRIENNNNGRIIKEFFELSYSMLQGDYIRGWLSEEYEKDRPTNAIPCCV